MEAQRVVFAARDEVELQEFAFVAGPLGGGEIAIRTLYSLISPGTELACLQGTESWAKLPFVPGYAACGEVIGFGQSIRSCTFGDNVLTYTNHASHARTDSIYVVLPQGLDPKLAPFARMAAVAMTALRVSPPEIGDYVAVLGLGLVGNLAAQLFALAGCEVIGIDVSAARREVARQCGLRHVLDGSAGAAATVRDITRGDMCSTLVEATGVPAVAEKSAALAGKLGEVVLLGSPRGEHQAELTGFLNQIHLWGNCVTFKGAHEWRYPVRKDPGGFHKHSIQRNVEILLRLMSEGRLHVEPLLTHVLPPSDCAAAYAGLRDHKDEYLGVLFDWDQQ